MSVQDVTGQNAEVYTEIEEKAIERGWSPKSEWEGDPDAWVGASEYVARGELMDRISSQTKQIKTQSSEIEKLKAAMKSLGETNKKIAEKEYDKALRDLKKQKIDALENDDHSSVVEIDEQIGDLKAAKEELDNMSASEASSDEPAMHPEVAEWLEKNSSWYETDTVMRAATDALAVEYLSRHPEAENDPSKALRYIENKLKEEFPSKFGSRKRPAATTDSGNGGEAKTRTKSKSRYTERDLTPEQHKIASTIVKSGVMEMQEYVDQLAAIGEIG